MKRARKLTVWVLELGGAGQFVLRWNDPDTRKRRQLASDATNREDAERHARRVQRELTGDAVDPNTWTAFRDRYELDCIAFTSAGNHYKWHSVANKLEAFAISQGTELELETLNIDLLSRFEANMRQSSPEGTIKSAISTLFSGLNYAAEIGLIDKIKRPRKRGREKQHQPEMHGAPITDNQFACLLKACPSQEWRRLLRLIYWGGLRISDAHAMHWTDNAYHRPVEIETDSPKWAFRSMQKSRCDELVAMAPEAQDIIRHEKQREGWVSEPTGKTGQRLEHVQSVGVAIAEIGKASGVKTKPGRHVTAHDLRRSFCHRWAQRVQPAVLMHMARHKDIKTTLKYYVGNAADGFADTIRKAAKRDAAEWATKKESIAGLFTELSKGEQAATLSRLTRVMDDRP